MKNRDSLQIEKMASEDIGTLQYESSSDPDNPEVEGNNISAEVPPPISPPAKRRKEERMGKKTVSSQTSDVSTNATEVQVAFDNIEMIEQKLVFRSLEGYVFLGVSKFVLYVYYLECGETKFILQLPQYRFLEFANAVGTVSTELLKPSAGNKGKKIECSESSWFEISNEQVILRNNECSTTMSIENFIELLKEMKIGVLICLPNKFEEMCACSKVVDFLVEEKEKGDQIMTSLCNIKNYEILPIDKCFFKHVFFNQEVIDFIFKISQAILRLHEHELRNSQTL